MTNETRLVLRATPDDLANVARIADLMRGAGHSFATRTDAVRHALAVTAAAMSGSVKATQ